MFEDITESTQDEIKEKIVDQTQIISDLEDELVDKERQLRDTDSRIGEYVEALDKMRDLLRRYFDKHGKSIFEEWEKEEKGKPDTS